MAKYDWSTIGQQKHDWSKLGQEEPAAQPKESSHDWSIFKNEQPDAPDTPPVQEPSLVSRYLSSFRKFADKTNPVNIGKHFVESHTPRPENKYSDIKIYNPNI